MPQPAPSPPEPRDPDTSRETPIPVRLERDEDFGPHAYWAAVDGREISRRAAKLPLGSVDRTAPGFDELPERGPEDGRPFGRPSTISAAEALRSLIADLRWWGLIHDAAGVEVTHGSELLDEGAEDPFSAPVPEHPGSVTGRAFLAANAGAAALDALDPADAWHERVDPDLIDQEFTSRDVLALAYGGPHLRPPGMSRVPEGIPGMHPAELYVDKDQREMAAECLNLYWRREVEARRRGEEPPGPSYRFEATVQITVPFPGPLADPWKTPEERVENLITALLSGPAVERFALQSGPTPLAGGKEDRAESRRQQTAPPAHDLQDVPFEDVPF